MVAEQLRNAGIKGAQDAAKKYGVTVDMFDSNWTPATQFNQAQNAISSGKYQAILAEMNDGNQACAILSKEAPAKGVMAMIACVNAGLIWGWVSGSRSAALT